MEHFATLHSMNAVVKGYIYLTECALSSVELYDSHHWNENDGGKRHDPANGLSPPWVGIGALVRQ